MKTLTAGLNVRERETVPAYLVVLVAELCGGDTENPLRQDKYTIRPAWRAVENYLTAEKDDVFSSAVQKIWQGDELTEEESSAVSSVCSIAS